MRFCLTVIICIVQNGIYVVVAVNFARIFRQNMYNCGLLAVEMDKKSVDDMFRTFAEKDTECKIVFNDDGTAKVKLIAGSLSKSSDKRYRRNVE